MAGSRPRAAPHRGDRPGARYGARGTAEGGQC